MKFTLRSSLLVAAFFCAGRLAYSQGFDTIVEIPTTAHKSAIVEVPTTTEKAADSSSDINVTMGGEYKSTKDVVEEHRAPFWTWLVDVGYETEYNFRGTNLMPESDGGIFVDAAVTKWNFTLGVFVIKQLGTARFPSFSAGEGGGGGAGGTSSVGSYSPETVQTKFSEIDVFLTYRREFGPVEMTVGNIGFFIDREAETFLNTTLFGLFGPFPTVGDEQFDRVFIRLATNVIPHIQPWITYYQTIYSEGEDHRFYSAPSIPPGNGTVRYGNPFTNNFHERNDRLGGYLEGRLRGSFPVGERIDINPYAVISYSFHDRSEPVGTAPPPGQPETRNFRDIIRGRSLSGFNVAQVGLEVPIHLFTLVDNSGGSDARFNLIPFGAYSYHISRPTAGTDRNEVWGGAKLAVTF